MHSSEQQSSGAAQLRKTPSMPERATAVFAFGPYRLFPSLRRLERAARAIELGSRAFDILCVLVEHAGEIVTNRELMARVWGRVLVGEGSLRFHINALRNTLAQDNLGAEYVKNVARRGYYFVAPVQRTAVEPPASTDPTRVELGKLPRRPGRIVGRTAEIQDLVALLGETRFITIVGSGGVGKSTVAVEVAYLLHEQFDLVRFVDLETIEDASLVASAVASALGLIVASANPVSSLIAYLREKRALLIFDSCERVLEGAAMLAEQIFDGSPRTSILATSQEALRAEGERTYLLNPLAAPAEETQLTPEDAIRYPAVELFVSRARETVTQFELTVSNVAAIGAICHRVDGIPLAIELAAGRAGTLALPTILALLNSQFSLTWPGRRTAAQRHRTLGAAIAWTVELLDERERVLLRRLAIFSGPFTLEAAQQVTSGSALPVGAIAEALSNLVAKSLVSSSSLDQITQPGSLEQSTHFWLLGGTRAFARQMMEDGGEADEVARRHAIYLCEFLERTYAGSSEFAHAEEWRSHAAYLTNVRAALDWGHRRRGETELLPRLAAATGPFLLDLSLLSECVQWASIGLGALGSERGSRLELELQASLGLALLFSRGSVEEARIALTRGLELAGEQRDHYNQMRMLGALNSYLQRPGDLHRALNLAEQAKEVAASLNDPAFSALADWLQGATADLVGDHATARRLGERAWSGPPLTSLVKRVRFGFDDHRIRALCGWARSLWLLGLADEARTAIPRVAREAERSGHPIPSARALCMLTHIWLWTGDWDAAEEYSRRLIAHAEEHSLRGAYASARGLQGQLSLERGDARAGLQALLEATEFVALRVHFSEPLARAYAQLGRIDEALVAIDRALEANEGAGGSWSSPEFLRVKGSLLAEHVDSRRVEAQALFRQSLARARQHGSLAWELRTTMSLVRCDQSSKATLALLKECYSKFSQGFETRDLILARQLLAESAQQTCQASTVHTARSSTITMM
jgi:predicted ATPase/DNA-binding winged helix-turn-helix (wHTH) protein